MGWVWKSKEGRLREREDGRSSRGTCRLRWFEVACGLLSALLPCVLPCSAPPTHVQLCYALPCS